MDNLRQINDLVSAVNDAAGLARTLIAGFLLVALTMAAMVVGTSDEAIFRNSLDIAPTLGVSVSVSVAHLYAPIILVFLHVSALIQLDLVAERLRVLDAELYRPNLPGSERNHQRMRIHGLARMYLLAHQEKHGGTEWLLKTTAWLTIVFVPLAVLLALQIGFLRYQSSSITVIQQVAFVADMAALRWFQLRFQIRHPSSTLAAQLAQAGNAIVICFGLIVSILFAGTPFNEDNARNVRWAESRTYALRSNQDVSPRQWDDTFPEDTCTFQTEDEHKLLQRPTFADAYVIPILAGCNPLDIYVCPNLSWGCRFLRLSHRKLVAQDIPVDLIKRFFADHTSLVQAPGSRDDCRLQRKTKPKTSQLTKGVEVTVTQKWARLVGLRLRGRSFRFSDFEDSSLYGIDLINSSLEGASFEGAGLQWSWFDGANLKGAVLDDAHLQHASFIDATLEEASVREAQLYQADLTNAQLTKAKINRSDLTGAKLSGAFMKKAALRRSILTSADLRGAILDDADLECATLHSADLTGASLINADLGEIAPTELKLAGAGVFGMKVDTGALNQGQLGPIYGLLKLMNHPMLGSIKLTSDKDMPAVSEDGIAASLTKLACKQDETWIGNSMLHWLKRQRIEADSVVLRRVAAKTLKSFRTEMEAHRARIGACSGLSDLPIALEAVSP